MLWTDVNFIMASYEGHNEMLKALFGSGDGKSTVQNKVALGADGKPLKLTPNAFDAVFDGPRVRRRK